MRYGLLVSPDGKYLAYGDLKGFHLKLIKTGETKTIPPPAALAGVGGSAVWSYRWFPDGTRLLAISSEGGRVDMPSLWSVSILGGTPRKLYDGVWGTSLSPDGSLISFVSGGPQWSSEIWLMGANGEDAHKILEVENSGYWLLSRLSLTTGRRIAYLKFHRSPDKFEASIESCDLKGRQTLVIVSDPSLQDFCWLPGTYARRLADANLRLYQAGRRGVHWRASVGAIRLSINWRLVMSC